MTSSSSSYTASASPTVGSQWNEQAFLTKAMALITKHQMSRPHTIVILDNDGPPERIIKLLESLPQVKKAVDPVAVAEAAAKARGRELKEHIKGLRGLYNVALNAKSATETPTTATSTNADAKQ